MTERNNMKDTTVYVHEEGALQHIGDLAGGEPESRMQTTLVLRVGEDQCLLHLHLIEVDDSGIAYNPELREDVGLAAGRNGCDPAELAQITIGGCNYVAVAIPYGQQTMEP
jgi:hypothetical protein